MDLLSILRTLWRHKLVTAPVLLLTLAGGVYALAFQPADYEASTSLVLISPPPPPTEKQIREDPSLANVETENPYARFYDQSIVVEIVARSLDSNASRSALVARGADNRFTVTRAGQYGGSGPVAEITALAASAPRAAATAQLVSDAFQDELRKLQAAEGVDERYMIRALLLTAPEDARLKVSSKLRSAVGVVGLGAFTLLVAISIAEAISTGRRERRTPEPAAPTRYGWGDAHTAAGPARGPAAPPAPDRPSAGLSTKISTR
ncbi:MAG: Wzz/FepE/Etk N-terminal domain-containing protein [Acidimicrobiales bacterium]